MLGFENSFEPFFVSYWGICGLRSRGCQREPQIIQRATSCVRKTFAMVRWVRLLRNYKQAFFLPLRSKRL